MNTHLLRLAVVASTLPGLVRERYAAAKRSGTERGSLTLEQIIWTVAIAVIALAITVIVVNAINTKAGELPL